MSKKGSGSTRLQFEREAPGPELVDRIKTEHLESADGKREILGSQKAHQGRS